MTRLTNSRVCELCGHVAAKAQMGRHLASCAAVLEGKGPTSDLIHLRFEATGAPLYWLHVEARGDATLQQVDALLRRVWLECCGHMSAFHVGQAERGMRSRVGSVFHSQGLRFSHEYDFGTTTTLKGEVLAVREGSMGPGGAVRLLARNSPLVWSCSECEKSAAVICPLCSDEEAAVFCATHAKAHRCSDDVALLPIVNSPRMGVCGYTG